MKGSLEMKITMREKRSGAFQSSLGRSGSFLSGLIVRFPGFPSVYSTTAGLFHDPLLLLDGGNVQF